MSNELKKYDRESILKDIETDRLRLLFLDMQTEEADTVEVAYQDHEMVASGAGRIEPAVRELIDRGVRRKHVQSVRRTLVPLVSNALKAAACIIVVASIGISTAFAISSTARYRIMELLISMTDEYALVSLQEGASIDIPTDWAGGYYPSYLPEGFSLVKVYGNQAACGVIYQNDEGIELDFDEYTQAGQTAIDTEDAFIANTTVHDNPAMITEKDGVVTVVWAEYNRYFCVTIAADADTAVQIARSVVRID